MEFTYVKGNTYYIKNATNIGVYKINENEVILIDTGNDKEAGKKILKVLESNNLKVKSIINTHSNADHVGGNKVIQDRTSCDIYANNIEAAISNYPIIEPSFLYGGYPFKDLKNKFLCAKESKVSNLIDIKGIHYIDIKGHFFDMIGVKTSDNVYFLGDALFSAETINKYHIFFIYDVREFLNTLSILETLDGDAYICSHVEILSDIKDLIKINRDKVYEIIDNVYNLCNNTTIEDILK